CGPYRGSELTFDRFVVRTVVTDVEIDQQACSRRIWKALIDQLLRPLGLLLRSCLDHLTRLLRCSPLFFGPVVNVASQRPFTIFQSTLAPGIVRFDNLECLDRTTGEHQLTIGPIRYY